MILRELKKSVEEAYENISSKRNTKEQRAEWRKRYQALRKIADFIKNGDWADEDERKKITMILSKGYKQAGEEYGVSRQALSNAFKRANSKLEEYIPILTIHLIMRGYIKEGLSLMDDIQNIRTDGVISAFFPRGVIELLPAPSEGDDSEIVAILDGVFSPEFKLLQSIATTSISQKLKDCDRDRLANLLWAITGGDGDEDGMETQFKLIRLMLSKQEEA